MRSTALDCARRWIDSLRDIGQAAQSLTRLTPTIAMMDHNADCCDLGSESGRDGLRFWCAPDTWTR